MKLDELAPNLTKYLESRNVRAFLVPRKPGADLKGRKDYSVMVRTLSDRRYSKAGVLVTVDGGDWHNIVFEGELPFYKNPSLSLIPDLPLPSPISDSIKKLGNKIILQYTNHERKDGHTSIPFP